VKGELEGFDPEVVAAWPIVRSRKRKKAG